MKNLLYLLLVVFLVGALCVRAQGDDVRTKSDYIFLEAHSASERGDLTSYYMLLRRAASLAPDDPFIAGDLAGIDILFPETDSLWRENAYSRLKRRFYASPDEIYGSNFAEMAVSMDRYDDAVRVWETLDSLLPQRSDPAVNLATALLRRYVKNGDTADINRAVRIYDRLERGVGPSLNLSLSKMRAYGMLNDTTAIFGELHRLEKYAPADVDVLLLIGSAYGQFNRRDSALAYFDKAAALDPDNGSVYLTRAGFFQDNGDSVAFDREVFRALESQNLEFSSKMQLLTDYVVKLYTDTAHRGRIEQMFALVQDLNPGEPDFHDLYGRYLATINRIGDAAEQFAYSIDLDPEHEERWQAMIDLYNEIEDTAAVESKSLEGMKLFPRNAYFPLMASSVMARTGRERQALDILKNIDLSTLPNDRVKSLVFGQMGDVYYQLEEPDSAIVQYGKAIEYDSENFMSMNNCAYFSAVRGVNLDQAELYASLATASDPDNPTYSDTYAWVMFRKKDYKRAREIIDQALKSYGLLPGADAAGDVEEVIVDDVEKPDYGEPSVEIYDHAGDIYFMTGEPGQALEFWKKALELAPENKAIKKKVDNKTYFFE